VLFKLLLGTVQGSILGAVLYSIFISPVFEIEELYVFADDSFIPRWNTSFPELIYDIEKSLESITKWLRKSRPKVNENKTKLCLFKWHQS
jgi:hypothetical protein